MKRNKFPFEGFAWVCSRIYHVAFIMLWLGIKWLMMLHRMCMFAAAIRRRIINLLITWGSHVRKGPSTSRQNKRCPYDEVKYGARHMYGFIPCPRVFLWPNTCALSFSHSLTTSPCSATCRLLLLPLSALEIRVITPFYSQLHPYPSFSFSFIKKQ